MTEAFHKSFLFHYIDLSSLKVARSILNKNLVMRSERNIRKLSSNIEFTCSMVTTEH